MPLLKKRRLSLPTLFALAGTVVLLVLVVWTHYRRVEIQAGWTEGGFVWLGLYDGEVWCYLFNGLLPGGEWRHEVVVEPSATLPETSQETSWIKRYGCDWGPEHFMAQLPILVVAPLLWLWPAWRAWARWRHGRAEAELPTPPLEPGAGAAAAGAEGPEQAPQPEPEPKLKTEPKTDSPQGG